MTLYNQISINKQKTFWLISVFLILITAFGWALSYYFNNPVILWIAVFISITQAFISYYYSDKIALGISQAKPVDRREAVELHRIVENLALTAGLPKPKIYLIDDTAANAFATCL